MLGNFGRYLGLLPPIDEDVEKAKETERKIIKECTRQKLCYEVKRKDYKELREVKVKSTKIFSDKFEIKINLQGLPYGVAPRRLREDDLIEGLEGVLGQRVTFRHDKAGFWYIVHRTDEVATQNFYYRELRPKGSYDPRKTPLLIPVGRDDFGKQEWMDLAKAPHLFIAGATGQGKSSHLHSMLCWIASHANPADVRILIVDLKRLDFPRYNPIPHMLMEVAIDMGPALNILQFVRTEIVRRSDIFREVEAPDIDTYMKWTGKTMPRIVFIIDEIIAFDDLKYGTKEEREEYNRAISLLRVESGIARALGIHIVGATQRPDATVIDGTMKANFTHWFAYGTNTAMDSRIVIDDNAAQGLPIGDLIYKKQSTGPDRLKRLRGPFIDIKSGQVGEVIEQVVFKYQQNQEKKALEAERRKNLEQTREERVIRFIDLELDGQAKVREVYNEFRDEMKFHETRAFLDTLEKRGILSPSKGRKARTLINRSEDEQN